VAPPNTGGFFSPGTVGPVSFTAPGSAGPRFAGTINSTNLAANPIDSDLFDVPNTYGGNLITFAITVENVGGNDEGAFDVRLDDTLPVGFSIPLGGINIFVSDGTGAPIAFTDGAGGAFQDLDLFTPGLGIELVDPGPTAGLNEGGALDPFDPIDGRNIAIITYDLELDRGLAPQSLVNTATVYNFSFQEEGADLADPDLTDPAVVTITEFFFVYDVFFDGARRERLFPEVKVFQPFYSGTGEPGSTLLVDLFDARGNLIGSESTMVDAGGNWSTNFFNTFVTDEPHSVVLRQTYSGQSPLYDAGYNLRTYFSPAILGGSFISEHLTVENVLGKRAAGNSLNALHAASVHPLMLGWNAYPSEFLAAPPTASGI
jgi:hypothetical protein